MKWVAKCKRSSLFVPCWGGNGKKFYDIEFMHWSYKTSFSFVIDVALEKAGAFFSGKHEQLSLTFVSKAGKEPMCIVYYVYLKVLHK